MSSNHSHERDIPIDARPATRLAHAGGARGASGGIVPDIGLSTTFARDADYALMPGTQSYVRAGTGGWRDVETLMTELEGGVDARLFASGLAASTVLFQALAPGDGVVVPDIMYHGLRDWLSDFCKRWGVPCETYRAGDLASLDAAVRVRPTRLVWVETPANPTWDVTDIAAAADIAHRAGAWCAVDSTVATPILTRPLALGADFVVHSATKSLNGHSDVLAGIVVAGQDGEYWQRVGELRTGNGAVAGAFEAWLLLRGLRTLHLRVASACDNAATLAAFLDRHPRVRRVLYPGLESHPGHPVAARQMQGGFGAMLSILVDGEADTARRVAGATRVFVPATSLGGVESLIEHRASVEGPNSPVPGNLLRLSVGIEAIDDLVGDLDRALGAAAS